VFALAPSEHDGEELHDGDEHEHPEHDAPEQPVDPGAQPSDPLERSRCGRPSEQAETTRDRRTDQHGARPAPPVVEQQRHAPGSTEQEEQDAARTLPTRDLRHAVNVRRRYSMRMLLVARPMTSCWICSVPSKMS
jgi:hypothetical protein